MQNKHLTFHLPKNVHEQISFIKGFTFYMTTQCNAHMPIRGIGFHNFETRIALLILQA